MDNTKDLHPVVRFYIMRYKNGKTEIPEKWRAEVMEYIENEKIKE